MKKKIILSLLILIFISTTIIFFKTKPIKEIKELSVNQKLTKIGYKKEDVSSIDNSLKDILLKYDYNENYISIIKHEDFVIDNFEKYILFYDTYNLDIDNTIFIINNNYETNQYTETVLKLMHQNYYIHNRLDRYLSYLNNQEINDDIVKEAVTNVNTNLDHEFYTVDKNTDLEKKHLILVNKYYKLDKTYIPENLVTLDSKYGKGQLEKETYDAFIKMYNDALNDSMNLYVRSAYRSYNTQYSLYNSYANKDGVKNADTYSARAGYSEHQTGLAFDLTTKNTTLGTFENTKEFIWMKNNAYKYGFILRYPKGLEYITGYVYEPWHYRYVGIEVAQKINELGITFDEYYPYYIDK